MLIIFIFIFLTITTVYLLVGHILFSKPNYTERLDKYLEPIKESEEEIDNERRFINPRKILSTMGEKVEKIRIMKKYSDKLQDNLIKAGIPLKSEELLSIQTMLFVVVFLMMSNYTKSVLISISFSVLWGTIPIFIVNIIKKKRYKQFNDQLGDSITLISNSLRSGQSFLQAISSVAKEMPDPISKEFEKLLKEMKLGIATEKALQNLVKRVESDDLELMVSAVLIQRQIGGNLSEILDNISETIRQRIKLKGEIKTLTAQGRLSGIIVSLLPIGLGLALFVLNRDYIMELFNSTLGLVIVGVGIVNQMIGIIVINKIVKIEV